MHFWLFFLGTQIISNLLLLSILAPFKFLIDKLTALKIAYSDNCILQLIGLRFCFKNYYFFIKYEQ